jgi:4-hydroxy-3-polyprenylbenzoate decarboxylase
LKVHAPGDFFAPVASGSFLTTGMVICPCSGTTLSGVVHGTASNLIQRAAEVHLKERRRLVLVPRETPVSLVHVENLRKACLAGAVVLPASPGWYHGVRDLQDLVDFIVARILDQLEIPHQLMRRWGAESGGAV